MGAVIGEMGWLITINVVLIGIASLILVLLAVTKKAAFAVLKRNFIGYFSNPTGYVFLCLFVLLTSAAAFWPHEFFVANLANLDQLNKNIALILLVFIPAITMSIWAEERRQGTDELLLTLPAADFDIVIGKYLAAAAIFTVSLLFSQIANYSVLVSLAWDGKSPTVDIDTGLFFTTYLGYWLMGLSMIAIGMVASFLTNNLTVSFILSLLFNFIPVVTYYADVLVPTSSAARQISKWSLGAQFDDFGRGVISLSSVSFFLLLIALGLYLSLALIGKRHWVRHDATSGDVLDKVLAIAGVICGVLGLGSLLAAVVLTGDQGLVALLAGLALSALGVGLYVASCQIAKPKNDGSMWVHYTFRSLALIALTFGLVGLLSRYDYIRPDTTEGQVSSLSPDTRKLLRELSQKTPRQIELEAKLAKTDKQKAAAEYATLERQIKELEARRNRPLVIDAYITANVPEEYVKLRYNLVSLLKELESLAGSRVTVNMHDNLEPFSEEAAQAEERFGIRKQTFVSQARGTIKEEEFIMGAAFTSGLEKVVVPSFSLGTPVEYELVRSIATVGHGQPKKLGIVRTDAQLMGGFTFAGMQPRQIPKQAIVDELEKQYKVEEIDPANPIEPGKYDVMLVAQPSSLGPQELNNVTQAIAKGQPTAIFEDAMPYVMGQVVGTAEEKPPMGGGMFGGGQPQPKGDIRALWRTLGIQVTGQNRESDVKPLPPATIVWQNFNPYPKFQVRGIGPEFVFIRDDAPGAANAFAAGEPVSAGFEELLLTFPTGLSQSQDSKLDFTELVSTSSTTAGTISVDDWRANQFDATLLEEKRGQPTKDQKYVLAAWIREKSAKAAAGKGAKDATKSGDKPGDAKAAGDGSKGINVIYIGDLDILSSEFVQMRNQPNPLFNFRFDNVPFVLNVIDAIAGDSRFLEIRKRKPRHSTLRMIEAVTADAREKEMAESRNKQAEYNESVKKADEESKKTYDALQKAFDDLTRKSEQSGSIDPSKLNEARERFEIQRAIANRRAEVEKERLKTERDKALAAIQRERDQKVQARQNDYKFRATLLPVIPPLLLGLVVFGLRRMREREGISRTRMRNV